MAVADYTSGTDLKAVDFGGLLNESVMQAIFDISQVPLPFTEMVASGSAGQEYHEWVEDKLPAPVLGGWQVDGADSDQNDSVLGTRLGNDAGILTREVQVTERASASDSIGTGPQLAYQVMRRQQDLRRRVESNCLGQQGSQKSDANAATPGIPAGLAAMMTQFDSGSGATGGGFSNGLWTGITTGVAPVPLTETMVRDAAQATWLDGGDPTTLMSVPNVISELSQYMFSSSSRIATLTRETQGVGSGGATALGAVSVFITDYGVTLEFNPNRLQLPTDVGGTGDGADVYIFDPSYVEISYLKGYRTVPLAKSGLSEKRHMAVDFTLCLKNRDSGRVILDIDHTAPVTA